MATCILIQTEKAYKVQVTNTYVLTFLEKHYTTNKIELEKLLVKSGLKPTKITTTNTQQKLRKRGKAGRLITQFRPQKYYVKLASGQTINEETVKVINEKLNPVQI
jgi:ribosomal protein L23